LFFGRISAKIRLMEMLEPERGASSTSNTNERLWAMACHLTGLVGYLGVPFGNIIAPLIIWTLKKEEFPLVDDQGKESLNAQISYSIYMLIAGVLMFVLVGFVLFPIIYVASLIFVLIAAVKANDGVRYRYPAIFRFIK
jgi:uncharacterized Tic20 family protein